MSEALSPELEQKAQALAARLRIRADDTLLAMARRLVATTDDTLFGDTEFALRDRTLGLVADAYAEHLEKKSGYVGSGADCPCGRTARFHGYRPKTVECLGGAIECTRAYYYCGVCGEGFCPWDTKAGLTDHRLSPAVDRLATLCGAVGDSFEKGADLLVETAGIRLGESTVRRVTEAAGERIAERMGQGRMFGGKQPWDWFCDATGQTVGYIAIDATGVRQQGDRGGRADGRMAYVGMIFNPLPDSERVFEGLPKPGDSMRARYVSGLYPLAEMGPLLRTQGAAVGLDRAKTWVALSDGGAGLEDFLRVYFPRVEAVILDFYHAAEYLAKLARTLHPDDEGASLEQTKAWARILRDEGGTTMIAVLDEWDWPPARGLKAVRAEVLGYFRNQAHRMDYPTYEANGWFIGSGAVESACKTVVGQRLKGSGMRWGESGSHALCHVRALYRSEPSQWIAFWKRSVAA